MKVLGSYKIIDAKLYKSKTDISLRPKLLCHKLTPVRIWLSPPLLLTVMSRSDPFGADNTNDGVRTVYSGTISRKGLLHMHVCSLNSLEHYTRVCR
jgi:predicted transcriptional regulator with HTH domain